MRSDIDQSRKRRLLTLSLLALVVLALLLLAPLACGSDDSPTAPTGNEGAASFSYSGGASGSFAARGTLPTTTTTLPFASWAAGGRQGDSIAVVALHPRTSPRGDLLLLALPGVAAAPSTLQLGIGCSGSSCPGLVVFLNADVVGDVASQLSVYDWLCVATSGSVSVSALTTDRVRGSFTGTLSCIDDAEANDATVTVTGGSFDVPLLAGLPTAARAAATAGLRAPR